MTNLAYVLQHKGLIQEAADKLGFNDTIRIAKYGVGQLTLVVNVDPTKSVPEQFGSHATLCLTNWLLEKFHVLVYVLNEASAKNKILQDVVNKSIEIDNLSEIEKLFQKPLTKVNLNESFPEEPELIEDLRFYLEPSKQLDNQTKQKLIKSETSKIVSSFFTEEKISNSSQKKRNIDETVDNLFDHREQFKTILSEMSETEFNEFHKKFKSIIQPTSSLTSKEIKSN